jgi:DNA-binding SARP family transcriptional activator
MAVGHPPTIRAAEQVSPNPRLSLANEFQLTLGRHNIAVPRSVQRLLAFLAVAGRPVPRSRVAGQLWFDVPEWRALGNLRSALWRLRRLPNPMVETVDERLALTSEVEVDVDELARLTLEITTAAERPNPAVLEKLVSAADILPGWEEEWLIVARERFRELRLGALERSCEAFLVSQDYGSAAQAALAAVETEPFRESAQRLLVRVHIRHGNVVEAMRTYASFRRLLREELGIEPSPLMEELVASLRTRVPRHA